MSAPKVIKVYGRAKRANLNGATIEREEQIWIPSERGWFRTLDSYNHFVYRQNFYYGATLVCTCGGIANVYNFEAYRKFQSTNMGRIVCCASLVETGHHADGSTE
jgi:hypothetical protein